ncbi:hypothetical protein [Sulfurospirillum arcachonense]|uniref:hypothetical protein n=1 Tax=Sulfurospirillum arcachonense TaxID=57666 RepID=UPI00046AF88B|nr:hypothetical protein [Sulfurospirillum arcachonense]
MNFLRNDYVKVKSFLGTKTSINEVGVKQNYWKLINHCGKVLRKREIAHLAFSESELQLLVQFGDEVDKYNLSYHNEEKNSFWILHSDLELVSTANSA